MDRNKKLKYEMVNENASSFQGEIMSFKAGFSLVLCLFLSTYANNGNTIIHLQYSVFARKPLKKAPLTVKKKKREKAKKTFPSDFQFFLACFYHFP